MLSSLNLLSLQVRLQSGFYMRFMGLTSRCFFPPLNRDEVNSINAKSLNNV